MDSVHVTTVIETGSVTVGSVFHNLARDLPNHMHAHISQMEMETK